MAKSPHVQKMLMQLMPGRMCGPRGSIDPALPGQTAQLPGTA